MLLLSRATHEQSQTEIALLRSQLSEKEAALSSLFIRQQSSGGNGGSSGGCGGGSGSGGGGCGGNGGGSSDSEGVTDIKLSESISFGVHEAQFEALERKNEELDEQNRKYALALETSEAKGRALMAEIKNMRDRWQSPAAAAAREDNEKKHRELEMRCRTIAAELEGRRVEIRCLVDEKKIMAARMQVLESSGGNQQRTECAEDTEGAQRWAENDKLLARLRAYETGNASLNKTISVLKTVVKTNEQSNVDLQKKNLDLIAEINSLEAQYEGTQKKNIILEFKNSELEDDKTALETRLKNLGGGDENTNRALETSFRELTSSNQHLEAKINQLVDTRKSLEAKNRQLSDNNKHLTDTNIKLLDSRKAAEAKTQQHQDDKARLEANLRKADKASTAQRIELEDANKKLIEDKSYLARKHERQSQKIQDLENEVSALQERSSRMMGEIHTLRNDKSRLEQHLDSLIRQEKNKRRLSVDNRDRPEFASHVKNESQINNNAAVNGHKSHENSASPVVNSRGTKRSADDRGDLSPLATTNGRNYTIRSIAENSPVTPHPLPSPIHNNSTTNSGNNSSPPPQPQTRSLFDRVKPPPPESRSLFDRIAAPATPSPPSRPQLDRELDELIAASAIDRRGVFCRFHGFQPKVAELLSLICCGPLESVRMALEKDIAFLWFLRPRDAAAFMAYARISVNGGKVKLPHPRPGEPSTSLEFVWNEKPVRALERDIATNIVRYGASRVFVIHFVPYDISLQKLIADVGGKRIGFWICEGEGGKLGKDGVTKGREVVVEFTNVRDAVEARKRIGGDWWGDASWMKEGCDRAPSTA